MRLRLSHRGRDYPGLAWCLIPVLLIAGATLLRLRDYGFAVLPSAFHDADTQMRLAVIRDILAHGWQQGYFPRVDPPGGMVFHWTKPFFYFIILLERWFSFLPPERALLYAGFFAGPILSLLVAAAAFWAARAAVSAPVAAAIAVGTILSSSFRYYSWAGVASHHTLMVLTYVLMVGFALRLAQTRSQITAATAGLIAAFAVWVSPEMLGFAGLLFLLLFALWIRYAKTVYAELLLFATAFAFGVMAATLVDPPYGGYRSLVLDRVGVPLLMLCALPLCVVLPSRLFRLPSAMGRAMYAVGASAVLLGTWGFYFLILHRFQIQTVNPVISSEITPFIEENRPIRYLPAIVAVLGNGILALAVFARAGCRTPYYLPILLILLCLGLAAQACARFNLYFWIAGTFVLGWALQQEIDRYRARPVNALQPLALIFCCVFIAVGCQLVWPLLQGRAVREVARPSCRLTDVLPDLGNVQWLGGPRYEQALFATDLSASLMFLTQYRTLGAGYHRDPLGLNDVLLIMRDTKDETARNMIAQRGVDFLLVCADGRKNTFAVQGLQLYMKYQDDPGHLWPPTLFRRLTEGTPPPWLEAMPWSSGIQSSLRLFRVRRESTAAK